jgi:hypothetical protein
MNNTSTSQFTSLCLKIVGLILIISALLDYLTLAIPFQPLDSQWQISFTGQIVDRGIVPMVGISFILVAAWIDATLTNTPKKSGFDVRLPVFILASILGLLFLLLVPLHLNNLRLASDNAINQIQQGADQAETRIKEQYDQLNVLAQDPQRLQQLEAQLKEIDQAIGSGKFQGQTLNPEQLQRLQETQQQLQNFRELAKNPEALETRLSELQTQLRDQKLEREGRAKTEAIKQGLRTGLSSLMLAIGYIVIGWLGLKGFGGTSVSTKKASVR